jgi:hypothetical protein
MTIQKVEVRNRLIPGLSDFNLEMERLVTAGLTDVQLHICGERLAGRTYEELIAQSADVQFKHDVGSQENRVNDGKDLSTPIEKALPRFVLACQLIKDNFWPDAVVQSSPNASGIILVFEKPHVLAFSARSRSINPLIRDDNDKMVRGF